MAKNQPPRMVSGGPPKAANRGNPVPGGKAPAFRLPLDGGGTVALADFAGRKLVLYFYPRADTSGSIFQGSKAHSAAWGRAFWESRRIQSRRWTASNPSTSSPSHWHRTRHTRCSKPMAYGSKRPVYGRKFMG